MSLSSLLLSSLLFVLQELTVLQEELDILITRKEDYEAVSGVSRRSGGTGEGSVSAGFPMLHLKL